MQSLSVSTKSQTKLLVTRDFVQGSDLAETVLAELVVYAPGCDAK